MVIYDSTFILYFFGSDDMIMQSVTPRESAFVYAAAEKGKKLYGFSGITWDASLENKIKAAGYGK